MQIVCVRFVSVKKIGLVLIDLVPEVLIQRRFNDVYRKRNLDITSITNEILANKYFYKEYMNDINIKGIVVQNNNSANSINIIEKDLRG